MPCKVGATLTLATTDVFGIKKCGKNVTTEMNPECSIKNKSSENELKFSDAILLLLKIGEACCINK